MYTKGRSVLSDATAKVKEVSVSISSSSGDGQTTLGNEPLSLFARLMGCSSEEEADKERRAIRRRERERELYYREQVLRSERASEPHTSTSRPPTQTDAAQLATAIRVNPQLFHHVFTDVLGGRFRAMIREELERVLVEELPAAVQELVDRALSGRNGQQTRRV